MSDEDDFQGAFDEVVRRVVPDAEPPLTAAEIEGAVEASRRAMTWAASTAYGFGVTVLSATRSGRLYRALVAGTSDAAEPTFSTTTIGQLVHDGTVVWEDAGAASNVYDVGRAENDCWRLRKAKAVEYLGSDEQKIYDRCVEMERATAPVCMA